MLHSRGHSVLLRMGGWVAGEVENIAISAFNLVVVEVEAELGTKTSKKYFNYYVFCGPICKTMNPVTLIVQQGGGGS